MSIERAYWTTVNKTWEVSLDPGRVKAVLDVECKKAPGVKSASFKLASDESMTAEEVDELVAQLRTAQGWAASVLVEFDGLNIP